ncbi:hypothetical protein NKH77_48915 [Streptomyces sp. M19]
MTPSDRSHRPEIRAHTAAARTALLRPPGPASSAVRCAPRPPPTRQS